jgi:hypothetical protein
MESIYHFKRLYGDQFVSAVCFNCDGISLQKGLVDMVIDQRLVSHSLSLNPPRSNLKGGPAWKFYPPRLSPNTHELLIDNDLILYRKTDKIEEFLQTDDVFVLTEAAKRSYTDWAEHYIRTGFEINTGIIGLPPYYDLASNLNQAVDYFHLKHWSDHFDEQSLVAYLLQSHNTKIISIEDVSICRPHHKFRRGKCGVHLVGLNYGHDLHWQMYKNVLML